MTLVHHDARDYAIAASEAANHARVKMEAMFDKGRSMAAQAIEDLQRSQPQDYVIGHTAISFDPVIGEVNNKMRMKFQDVDIGIHPHAMNQIGDRVSIPRKYHQGLMKTRWGVELLAHILGETYKHQLGNKYLTRVVNGELRGFLSDKYRRMDSAPIVESFIRATTALGAIPVESRCLETKFYLKMMLPHIFEPVPNEVMGFGVVLQNSDYGDGALSMSGFLLRLWCTNLAICENALRKIHLGSRLGEDLTLSQRTYDLDTKALASAAEDVVSDVFSPGKVNEKLEIIKTAHEEKIDVKKVIENMRKGSKISREEEQQLTEIYNTPDVEQLPPGNTAWRLSNALSLFAQKTDPHRALELEAMAGEVAGLKKNGN